MTAVDPPTLHETAAVLGTAIWFERTIFETAGGLVTPTPEPRAKVVLSSVSRHAAARAEQLVAVLPRTHDLQPDDVVAPGPGSAKLDDLAHASTTDGRLELLAEILVAGADRLDAHRATLTAIAAAPVIRVLDLVAADLRRDALVVAVTAGNVAV